MLYLLLILIVIGLTYVVMRTVRANAQRPTTRVIGPDDEPVLGAAVEFRCSEPR